MSRIRSIKPEWIDDEPLGACSDAARVLSVALIITADDHGNGRLGRKFALRVWPDAPDKLDPAFHELVKIKFARDYVIDDQRYYSIRNWHKHQRIDNAGKPRVPGPPEDVRSSPPSNEKEKEKESQAKPASGGLAEFRGNPPRNSARPVGSALGLGRGRDRGPAAIRGGGSKKFAASEFDPPPELVNLAAELGLSQDHYEKTLSQYQTKSRSSKDYEKHCADYESFLRSTSALVKKSAQNSSDETEPSYPPAPLFYYRQYLAEGKLKEAEQERLECVKLGIDVEEN